MPFFWGFRVCWTEADKNLPRPIQEQSNQINGSREVSGLLVVHSLENSLGQNLPANLLWEVQWQGHKNEERRQSRQGRRKVNTG